MHSLSEELGTHKGRNGMTGCILCGDECESVVHVLWESPACNDSREEFVVSSWPYYERHLRTL